MALAILMKGSSPLWTEDNPLYDSFKALMKRVEMLMNGMALKKASQEFICHSRIAWSREMGHIHTEAAGLMDDNVNRLKYILDALKSHCKHQSNEIVAATAYK